MAELFNILNWDEQKLLWKCNQNQRAIVQSINCWLYSRSWSLTGTTVNFKQVKSNPELQDESYSKYYVNRDLQTTRCVYMDVWLGWLGIKTFRLRLDTEYNVCVWCLPTNDKTNLGTRKMWTDIYNTALRAYIIYHIARLHRWNIIRMSVCDQECPDLDLYFFPFERLAFAFDISVWFLLVETYSRTNQKMCCYTMNTCRNIAATKTNLLMFSGTFYVSALCH